VLAKLDTGEGVLLLAAVMGFEGAKRGGADDGTGFNAANRWRRI